MPINAHIDIDLPLNASDAGRKDSCLRLARVTIDVPVYSAPNAVSMHGSLDYALKSIKAALWPISLDAACQTEPEASP